MDNWIILLIGELYIIGREASKDLIVVGDGQLLGHLSVENIGKEALILKESSPTGSPAFNSWIYRRRRL